MVAFISSTAVDPAFGAKGPSARFHFERASAAFSSGRYEEALEHFLAVERLVSSPGTTFNIALCFNRLRREREEFFYFSRFLLDAQDDASRSDERAFAEERLAALESRVAQVRIESDPPGAEIYVDRKELGSHGLTPIVLALEPGRRRVWLEKPGFHEAMVEVPAKIGTQTQESVRLKKILGDLRVESHPPGEVVVTDETGATAAFGPTPFATSLPPGVYVVEASSPGHRPRREVAQVVDDGDALLKLELEPLPTPKAEVNVTSTPPGAVLYIDGAALAPTPYLLREIEPGSREFRVEGQGYQSFARSFDLKPTRYALAVSLERPPEVDRSPSAWVAGALGLAGLAAGTVTGLVALSTKGEYDRLLSSPDGSELSRLREQGLALATATDVLLIGGALSLGLGVVLYFATEKRSDRASQGYLTELEGPAESGASGERRPPRASVDPAGPTAR